MKIKNYLFYFSIVILTIFLCGKFVTSQETVPRDHRYQKSYVFSDTLNRTIPWIGQKPGAVKELYNMMRPAPSIPLGWKPRGGVTLHNTAAIASASIDGLCQYTNAIHNIDSFLTQCDDQIWLADNNPPSDTGGSFGSSVYTLNTNSDQMFTDSVNDYLIGAAGGTSPFIFSGGTAYSKCFLVSYNSAVSSYVDGTDKVSDDRSDTNVTFIATTGQTAYVGSPVRLDGIHIEITGTTNIEAADVYIKTYQNGSLVDVAGLSDGLADPTGTTPFYESEGHITWTYDSDDDPYLLSENLEHLFWYVIGVTDTIDAVNIARIRVNSDFQTMENLWSGYFENVASCLLSSATGYIDFTGEVTDGTEVNYVDLDGQTKLYIGSPYKIFAVYFYIDSDYGNVSENVYLKNVYYYDGTSRAFTAVSGTTHDSTSSDDTYAMHHNGIVQWDGSGIQEDKTRLGGTAGSGGLEPIYFYCLEWSAALPETRIYEIAVAQKPETIPPMPYYEGFLEHASRAWAWPGEKFKHGMDFAQEGCPYVWNGPNAGSTGDIFGPGIVNAATRLSSYVVVSTRDPYRLYLMQGKTVGSFDELLLSSNVGAVAPHTLITIEDGIKLFSTNLVYNTVFLMAPDGFYACDGRKPISISQPISDYFDTSTTPYIEPDYAHLSYSWIDYRNRLVLTAVPMNLTGSGTQTTCNVVLPYSYINNEWFDRWEYNNPPVCGASIVGSNNQRLFYMGDSSGYVYRGDYEDKDNETRIEHWLQTPNFSLSELPDRLNRLAILRSIKTKTKTDTVGSIGIDVYKEGSTSGVTPNGTMSLIRSGYDYTKGRVNCNEQAESFAFRFRAGHNSGDEGAEMEIYGFTCDYYDIRDTQQQ